VATKKSKQSAADKAAEDAFLDSLSPEDLELLKEPEKPKRLTATDRLERAFLEIVEFRQREGRLPSATTHEVSERKLGARLDGIRANQEKIEALRHLDIEFSLLTPQPLESIDDALVDEEFLELLDATEPDSDATDIFDTSWLPTKNSRASAEDDVERRTKCEDFATFAPMFKDMHTKLEEGTMKQVPESSLPSIKPGTFFVLAGMLLFVAEVEEPEYKRIKGKDVRRERTRIIFENGTESRMYRQSLAIRLGLQDGRIIVPAKFETALVGDDDVETGYVYVLRSLSDNPDIQAVPDLYKVGFSRGKVEKRIANAKNEPTYLMAPVELVASYRTYNMKTVALEHLLHRIFAAARLNVELPGIAGRPYRPSEWFSVPLDVINQAIEMISDGSIVDYVYDPATRTLVRHSESTAHTQ